MNTIQFEFFFGGGGNPKMPPSGFLGLGRYQNQTHLICFMPHWCFVITLIFSLFIIGCVLPAR